MKNLKKVLMSCVCISLLVVLITGCETKKETKSETKKETKKETNILDDNKSYLFIIDGKKIYAGDKISSLSKFGYNIREKEKDQEVPANKYMIGAGNMTNETNSIIFSVTPYNIESSAVKVTDAVIGGFRLSKSYAKNDEKAMNIEVYGKIKLGSTMEEVEKQGLTLLGVVPQDQDVYQYDCDGKPIVRLPKDSPVRSALHDIVQKLGL